jgi:hypothetical protein
VPFNAGDIEASLTLDRSPFTRGLQEARAEGDKFERKKITATIEVDRRALERELAGQGRSRAKPVKIPINLDRDELEKHLHQLGIKIPADLDQDALLRKIRSMASSKLIKFPAEVDQQSLIRTIDQIATNTETTASRSGNKIARALLNPVMIQLALLPGIALASAALAGGALALMPAAFAAVGGMALKGNEDIKHSYKDLWNEVKSETKQAAQVLQPYGLEIARNLWGGFKTIQPQIQGIFNALGPQILELSKGVTGFFVNLMPQLQRSVQSSGPAIRGLSSLLQQTGTGVGNFFEQISMKSLDVGHGLDVLGHILSSILTNVGQLLGTFATGWSAIGPNVERVIDKLLGAVNNFVSGGMTPFVTTTKIAFGVLEQILNVVGPIADIFGGMGGTLLGAVASWKLLAGAIGLVGKAWGLIAPAQWATKFGGVADKIGQVAGSMGGFITKVSGSEAAGSKFASAASKVGGAVVGSLKYVPLLGAAVAGVNAAIDHFYPSANSLADSILQGGKAAADARDKLGQWNQDVQHGSEFARNNAKIWGSSTQEVVDAIQKQRASMTETERTQQDLTIAQRDYSYLVGKFGELSPQAVEAQGNLARAAHAVEDAQLKAAQATQTHIDKIIAQTNLLLGAVGARLNYQSALLSLEQAQKDSAKATADAATATVDKADKELVARQASVAYQQQLLSVVNALGERVKAENADKSASDQAKLSTFAMHQEIARLAVVAGKDAPAALLQLAGGLSASELAAMGVTKEVGNTGQAVYTLPPGKTLSFPNDAPVAQSQVEKLGVAIENLPASKNLNFVLNTLLKYETSGLGGADSGLQTGWVPGRASGGLVAANQAYWVGEGGGRPELFFPETNGYVLNSQDSQKLVNREHPSGWSMAGGSGSEMDPQQMIALMVAALQRVFGDLRLRIDGQEWARLVNSVNTANGRR